MIFVQTALFVPGDRPERFGKALATAARRVIVDFEDAVEPALKSLARDNLASFLSASSPNNLMVRINAQDSDYYEEDLRFCREHPQLEAVIVPKAENAAELRALSEAGLKVWPLVESAKGILKVGELAGAAGVECMTFGALDLAASLGIDAASPEAQLILDQVRYALLVNSVAHGLAAPIDTVFPDIKNLEGLAAFARHGKGMGMGGMLCIHPSQVETVTNVYRPQEAEIAWARLVLEAAAGQPGVFNFEGQMIDAPVLQRARKLLEQH
ncbi:MULTISPECIES: CoA ester lyase [Pseudomonas]|uniref:HpcH/HpaI aldolase/citrate lyase family protein n=1 Tax=Pseudomonas TaxID=286 RepID=UPI00053F24B2|nr:MULTISPECIES: CoA ester lyase [Pseudomonas]HBN9689318.1 CoA ester lyase [Pseudomonas aeruginosa]